MVLIIANIVTGLALKTSKPSSVNPRVCLFISSLFSPPRGQLARKKQIQIMAEPMGKLKSNSLLFALAFGEEGRAGGVCPVPPRQLPYRWAAAGTSLCPDRESLLSPKSRDSDGFRSVSLFTLVFLQVIRIWAEISDL